MHWICYHLAGAKRGGGSRERGCVRVARRGKHERGGGGSCVRAAAVRDGGAGRRAGPPSSSRGSEAKKGERRDEEGVTARHGAARRSGRLCVVRCVPLLSLRVGGCLGRNTVGT